MTHGSLFSGIGGFDLAAEWMGWQNVFHCEWNTFGQRVLKHYWPNATSYHDITKTDFTIHRGRIDILTGGFPCQPYSMAGKRLGKEDDRHLWPEMLRAIREIQPRWVVGENVLGLVNWSDGLVFHEVQADLEAEGYEVQPFVLPAVSVNAPHRRDRVWFVAHARNISRGCKCGCENKREREFLQDEQQGSKVRPSSPGCCSNRTAKDTIGDGRLCGEPVEERAEVREQRNVGARDTERVCGEEVAGTAPDTNCNGQHGSDSEHEINAGQGRFDAQRDIEQGVGDVDAADREGKSSRWELQQQQRQRESGGCNSKGYPADTNGIGLRGQSNRTGESGFIGENEPGNYWQNFPTQSPICNGNDGIPDRLDSITFSKWRSESIKAGGNAVVPQVVLQIFRTIEQYEKMHAQ